MEPVLRPVRVLVADDSFFMRTVLSKLLSESGGIEVVGQARTGKEAVQKNLDLEPDVVTLDVEMPEMDGLEALAGIMRTRPVPVVMLSAHTGPGAESAVRALEMGAVECVGKPSGSVSVDIHRVMAQLVGKIRVAAASRPDAAGILALEAPAPERRPPEAPDRPAVPARRLVAVAASTGGPRALNELVSRLPADLPAALVVVQHMSPGFTQALARRLGKNTCLPVSEAAEGETPAEGRVYVAPAGRHLLVTGVPGAWRFASSDAPPRNGVKPAADLTLSSIAEAAGRNAVGVVLTGMGKDGAKGLLDMRQAGASTYAQDEDSCVVYGMPKAAVETGAAARQAPIPRIVASFLKDLEGTGD